MSITLEHFRSASLQGQGKLTVSNDNQVKTKGTGLGRMVEWFRGKTTEGRNAKNLENTAAKEKFLTAIRSEYGDVMADRAGHELGKHTSLKSRTVQLVLKNADAYRGNFATLHNAGRTDQIQKKIQKAVAEQGGMKNLYNEGNTDTPPIQSVPGQFKSRFGISLPPFDDKLDASSQKTLLDKQLRTAFKNGAHGLLGDQSFTVDSLRQSVCDATLRMMWVEKGGFSESQMHEFFSNPFLSVSHVVRLFEHAAETATRVPDSKEAIANNLTALFREALKLGLGHIAEAMVSNGVTYGILKPETPGVGEVYEKIAAPLKGGNKVQFLCAAEKCHALAGNKNEAAKIREQIQTELKEHMVRETGKDQGDIKFPSLEQDRQRLGELRKGMAGSAAETSEKLRIFVSEMYSQCLLEFGVDEKQQTMMMFGSGSRNEMFPFSDLEFAVLTKSDNGNEKLLKAIALFEMRITALGETPLGRDQTIPIREGLCFDPGGNSPKAGNDDLVGTPEKVLKKLGGDLIEVEVFSAAKVMVGNQAQCDKYLEGVKSYFDSKVQGSQVTKGQDYSIRNLVDMLGKMRSENNPITFTDQSNLQEINAKQLSRFPFFVASSLCKFHGVSPAITNTVDRLKALENLGVLTHEESGALEKAFNGFGELRLKAEVFYQGQEHEIRKTGDNENLGLNAKGWQDMLNLLEPLNAIFAKVERFTQDPKSEFQIV